MLRKQFDTLYDATLALIYPQACAVCGAREIETRADYPACGACWAKTRIFNGDEAMCWKCGALLESDFVVLSDEQKTTVRCHVCDEAEFAAARAIGVYADALRAAILNLKREPHIGARLIELMYAVARRPPLDAATRIMPTPLHQERERERGFNQATVLARPLAAKLNLPCDEYSLTRTEYTDRHRAGMDARARHETVADAFAVKRPRLVEGEKILLVDDVFTTGATASSCARSLREAGAAEVYVLTVARAIK